MESLRYYLDLKNDILFAYEEATEFFVSYHSNANVWVISNISFMQFRHDYELKEISAAEALEKTKGALPDEEYKAYIDTLRYNRGE